MLRAISSIFFRLYPFLILSLSILLIVACVPVLAQQASTTLTMPRSPKNETTRPKIGIVLSGGGARGLAHIGVLEWLEQHHIPIDYIAGTSFGGFVAAMYAMGMSPTEMRTFATTLNWDKAIASLPKYNELSFRRKEDRYAYPTDLEFGGRGGIRLPTGFNSGHYMSLVFDQLTLPYSTIGSFDSLPIPFACVATDMLAAEPVILRKGSLSNALRATIALPGIFTPIEIDGKVLADGGILNNIPTDVVKDMGADIIIAVNIGTPLGTREEIDTLPGLFSQVIGVITIQSDRRNLKLANFVIAPDLGKHTIVDFHDVSELIDLGYKGAEQQNIDLQQLSLDQDAWQDYFSARQAKKRTVIPTPTNLEIKGTNSYQAKEITKTFKEDIDQPINPKNLEHKLNEILGTGRYESLGYGIEQINKKNTLCIYIHEKSYAPPLINPLLQIESSTSTELKLSTGFRLTYFDFGSPNAELRTDIIFGSHTLFGVEYYRPIGKNGFFLAPSTFFSSFRTDLYNENNRVAQYLQRQTGVGLDIGYIFNSRTQLRIGYSVASLKTNLDIGNSLLPDVKGLLSLASVRFVYDNQNNLMVPTHGIRLSSKLVWYFKSPGAIESFPQAEFKVSSITSISEKGLLFGYAGAGTTFNKTAGFAQQFTLGGPFRLSAFGNGEFRGNHFVYSGVGYLYRLSSLPLFTRKKIYTGIWYENGSNFSLSSNTRYLCDATGAIILETPLGVLTLGSAFGVSGHKKVFFTFGKFF